MRGRAGRVCCHCGHVIARGEGIWQQFGGAPAHRVCRQRLDRLLEGATRDARRGASMYPATLDGQAAVLEQPG